MHGIKDFFIRLRLFNYFHLNYLQKNYLIGLKIGIMMMNNKVNNTMNKKRIGYKEFKKI